MSVEIVRSIPLSAEAEKKAAYSSNPILDSRLVDLDRRIADFGGDSFQIKEALEIILGPRAGNRERREINSIIKTAYHYKLYKNDFRDGEGMRSPLVFDRNSLFLAYVFIQLRGQMIPWRNVPYVAYHYLEDTDIRGEIARPSKPFDGNRVIQTKENKRLENLRERFGNFLMSEGLLDLREETIFSDIPDEFLPETEYSFQQRRVLTDEDLKELAVVVSAITHFRQTESVSAVPLVNSGFDMRDIDTVVKNYYKKRPNGKISTDVLDLSWMEVDRMLTELVRSNGESPTLYFDNSGRQSS